MNFKLVNGQKGSLDEPLLPISTVKDQNIQIKTIKATKNHRVKFLHRIRKCMANRGDSTSETYSIDINQRAFDAGLLLAKKDLTQEEINQLNEFGHSFLVSCREVTGYKKLAFNCFKKAAEYGDACALTNLGCCYHAGIGVAIVWTYAFKNWNMAAEKGNLRAKVLLGTCYENGVGVDISKEQAFNYYKEVAEKGNAFAKSRLGLCYLNGIGVDKNQRLAFECFGEAAAEGEADAWYQLGQCFEYGIYVEASQLRAFEYYQKGIKEGSTSALTASGYCYSKGIGVKKNLKKAFELWTKAASKDEPCALDNLGLMYECGVGWWLCPDPKKAFYCYIRAEKYGNPDMDEKIKSVKKYL